MVIGRAAATSDVVQDLDPGRAGQSHDVGFDAAARVVTETGSWCHCVCIGRIRARSTYPVGRSKLRVHMAERWYARLGWFAWVWCAACSGVLGTPAPGNPELAGSRASPSSPVSTASIAGNGGESGARASSDIERAGAPAAAAQGGNGVSVRVDLGAAGRGCSGGVGLGCGSENVVAGCNAVGGCSGGFVQGGGGTVAQGGSGAAAQGGSGAAGQAAVPSAGCAKHAPRPANGALMMSDRIYTFPVAYDGMTPAPLLLALHAAGNPNTQLQRITQGSKLETDFVRAFPKSAGNAWVYNTDIEKLNGVLAELLAQYCIDEHRIFATGHSSGAQMVVQMLCMGEQRFRAVAPVAASKYCAELAPIPVLYIQGQMDAQRGSGNGEDVVRVFRSGNGCGDTSAPLASVPSCTSSFDRKEVTPGCVSYEGCSVPTHWCSHNDNGYNNSDGRQHGWPCFANGAISDFFLSF